eukprot:3123321-Alexandrium_andersonii.AAC.1
MGYSPVAGHSSSGTSESTLVIGGGADAPAVGGSRGAASSSVVNTGPQMFDLSTPPAPAPFSAVGGGVMDDGSGNNPGIKLPVEDSWISGMSVDSIVRPPLAGASDNE